MDTQGERSGTEAPAPPDDDLVTDGHTTTTEITDLDDRVPAAQPVPPTTTRSGVSVAARLSWGVGLLVVGLVVLGITGLNLLERAVSRGLTIQEYLTSGYYGAGREALVLATWFLVAACGLGLLCSALRAIGGHFDRLAVTPPDEGTRDEGTPDENAPGASTADKATP